MQWDAAIEFAASRVRWRRDVTMVIGRTAQAMVHRNDAKRKAFPWVPDHREC